jgi:hypothetical protein
VAYVGPGLVAAAEAVGEGGTLPAGTTVGAGLGSPCLCATGLVFSYCAYIYFGVGHSRAHY